MIQQLTSTQSSQPYIQHKRETTTDFSALLTSTAESADITAVDETIYEELAQQYDVRNMTFEQLTEVGHMLYEAGAISAKDVMLLTFDYGRASDYAKLAAKGMAAPNFTMYETNADELGRRDWIAEFEARAAKDRQYGNFIANANKTKLISILQLIERD